MDIAEALSRDKLGHPEQGIDLLKRIPAEKLHQARNAAYAAVLLVNNNQPDLAREFLDAANAGPVFPEEKDLLRDALLRSESKAAPAATPERTPAPNTSPSPADVSPR